MEKLVSVAIRRDKTIHKGFRNHAELRRSLGDENPYQTQLGDQDGFATDQGRFLSRYAAIKIGIDAGQVYHGYSQGELTSDNIQWDVKGPRTRSWLTRKGRY